MFYKYYNKFFLKGLDYIHPGIKPLISQWSLTVVLTHPLQPPFEPMPITHLSLLTYKTVPLITITSAKHASELGTLRCDKLYLQFHKDKVTFHFSCFKYEPIVSITYVFG